MKDDANLRVADLEDRVAPVEHDDTALGEHARYPFRRARVVVVVSEDCDDGHGQGTAHVREHGSLVGEASAS